MSLMASFDVPSKIWQAPHVGGPGMSRLRKLLAVNAAVEAGAYTRPLFGSTEAHSVGQGCI